MILTAACKHLLSSDVVQGLKSVLDFDILLQSVVTIDPLFSDSPGRLQMAQQDHPAC